MTSSKTKTPERPKKKRKKKKSSSFSNLERPTADAINPKPTVKTNGASPQESERNLDTENTDLAQGDQLEEASNRKKADLEARKRQLLAVAAAAAEEPAIHLQGHGEDDPLSEQDEPEPTPVALSKPAKKSKVARLSKGGQEAEPKSSASKGKKSKSKSRLSLAEPPVDNDNIEAAAARQLPTPEASGRVQGRQTISDPFLDDAENEASVIVRHKSNASRKSTRKSKGKAKIAGEETNFDELSHERQDNRGDVSQDPAITHDVSEPQPDVLESTQNGVDDVATPAQAAVPEYPPIDSNISTPTSSPRHGESNRLSSIRPRSLAESSTDDRPQGKPTKETRILFPSAKLDMLAREGSAGSSINEESMELIDPSLRNIGVETEPRSQMIGIYKDTATPQTTGKRKRRLPIEDVSGETPTVEPKQKKARKSLLKPKTPKSKTSNATEDYVPEGSPDLDAPVSKAKRRVSGQKIKRTPKSKDTVVGGKFSDEEIEIIKMEMQKYREMHDITEYDLNQMIQDKAHSVTELWNEVGAALPDRPRQSILKVCRRRFHNYGVRGKWTDEDDRDLEDLNEQYPKRWKQIAQIMNRHPEDIRDRWRNYVVCGDNQKKSVWTEEEENNLRNVIAECVQAVRELKAAELANNPNMEPNTRPDIELIDWQIVSQKLGHTRSRLQCMTKWKQLVELEKTDDEEDKGVKFGESSWRVITARRHIKTMGREDWLELLLAIRDSQAGREGKIPWVRLGDEEFKQRWSCMTRKVAWKRLRDLIPDHHEMKLQDIVSTLIRNLSHKSAIDAWNYNASDEDEGQPSNSTRRAPTASMVHAEIKAKSGRGRKEKRIISDEFVTDELDDEELNAPSPDEVAEDEFDPYDIPEDHDPTNQNGNNFNLTQAMVRDAVDEAYEDELIGDEDGGSDRDDDGDYTMNDREQDDVESVDLGAPSQQRSGKRSAARLRSPISFKKSLQQGGKDSTGSSTHSDEEDVDEDIPARRPAGDGRQESVDLGEF